MYLIHVGREPIHDVVEGKLFTFPPGEVVEIADDFKARAMMNHKKHEGLTQVQTVKTRQGINFLTDEARKEAANALREGRKSLVQTYIKTQLDTRVRQNLAPMPPSPAIQKIIEEDGVDLREYGINPVGWQYDRSATAAEATTRIEEENKSLREELNDVKKMLARLLDMKPAAKEKTA